MVFSLFEYLDSVNCNHCLTLANYRDRKKKKISRQHEILLCIRCVSSAVIKNVKIARKKSIFSPKDFFNKIAVFPKSTD